MQGVLQLEKIYRTLLENIESGVIIADAQGCIVEINKAAEHMMGMSASEIEGRGLDQFLQGKNLSSEAGEGLLAGKYGFLPCKVIPIDEEDILEGYLCLIPISLIQAERLHDMKSPLQGIKGFAHLLQRELASEPRKAQLAQMIIGATEHVNKLMGDLLDFIRPLALVRRRIRLTDAVRKAISYCTPLADKAGVCIEIGQCEDLTISGDLDKLTRVFVNLLTNSIEATSKGGKVFVEVHREGEQGCVRIADTGCGIPQDSIGKIFEPFYTTKDGGTGLGLAVVKKIVTEHGGKIELKSSVGCGTEVKILIPLSKE